jgi:hypothetical protein
MTKRHMVFIGGNGFVFGIRTMDGGVAWKTELKKGWFKSGNSFVSLTEDIDYLFAFSYGILYKIDKETGCILAEGLKIKQLKQSAGVFSSNHNDSILLIEEDREAESSSPSSNPDPGYGYVNSDGGHG